MLETLIDIVSWAALLGGSVFYVIGAVGLNRMPDVFTRMHAVSVSDTLGIGLLTFGMILQAGFTLVAVKLIIIVLVVWTTGAVASHALARAALHDGVRPLLTGPGGGMKPTDCVELFPELGVRLAAPLSSETVEEPGGPVTTQGALPEPAEAGHGAGPEAGANRDAEPRAAGEAGAEEQGRG